jgi:hypothetical protein
MVKYFKIGPNRLLLEGKLMIIYVIFGIRKYLTKIRIN